MSTRDALAAIMGLTLMLVGCAADIVPAIPPGWLLAAGAPGASRGGYGAWVDLSVGSRSRWRHVAGESIACDRDSTWVLTPSGLVAVRNRQVIEVILTTGVDERGRPISQRTQRVVEEDLRQWSRFPQGLPAGVDRARLQPKP